MVEKFVYEIIHLEYDASQKIKAVLIKCVQELFGVDFPKTDFLCRSDGAYDEIKAAGILIDTLEPTGSYIMMLPEGLYVFMPHVYFGKCYPVHEYYVEAQPETYLQFSRKALYAIETAHRKLNSPD